ncbi:ABC transporter substrate-binding protein [Phytoactinopolyspora mesophila]|uniref:Extracellular solute-binding protein n=1 Tax=Phytoactinopolyspora mesophila TaxID=2650750 RepID=A0A7K3MBI6_9ACTN|nr:sugar ABC transporter substrate-binding protein [Phytoactinopolyspora mesophila]NDL60520.1 extracellular solute-binding protein [Phytoactinopolyspora mesophila]
MGLNLKSRLGTALVLSAGSALFLAACGSDNSGDDDSGTAADEGPVTIEFWGWVPGLEEAVEQWNDENPNIQVDFFRMTGDDGDKIPAAIDAGTAPDVVQMSVHSLPGHIVNNRLSDLTEVAGHLEDHFTPSAWGSVVFDGTLYAIPQDSGPTGLMYRKDIFDEHGIDVPTTWDEFIEAGRELKDADPDITIAQFSPNEIGFWVQSVWQNGGSWNGIEGDAWTVNVADPESLEVAEVWQTLLDEDLVTTVEMWTPEYWAEINAGTIATVNYAAWFPVLLEDSAESTAGNWAVAPSPTFEGSDAAGDTGGSVNVIPTGTEHVEQAAAFVEWLNTSEDGLEHLINGGIFPSAVAGLEHENLLTEEEFFGGQVINEVFAEAALTVPATWVDGPTYDLIQDAFRDEFAQVANGRKTFAEALEDLHARTVADLTDMGLSVHE